MARRDQTIGSAGPLPFYPLTTYWQKLQDPRWQRKRTEVLNRDEFTCRLCGDETTTLDVDHSYYEPGCAPWEYPTESLFTLCRPCHGEVGERRLRLMKVLSGFDCLELERVAGFALAVREFSGLADGRRPSMTTYETFGWSTFERDFVAGTGMTLLRSHDSPYSED